MSTSRAFTALMSMLACFAILATSNLVAEARSSTETTTGKPGEGKPARQGPVILKVADHSANFGGSFRLRGKTGNPYRGKVRVQADTDNGWKTLRRVETDSDGRYKTRIDARQSTRLRVLSADGRRSEARRVYVLGRIRVYRSGPYVKLGRGLSIGGNYRPRGVRTVKLQVRGTGDILATRTKPDGSFRFRWEPDEAGDFRYIVRGAGDSRAIGDASRYRKVTALRPGHASYYGPGLYGNGVACGGTLLPSTRGVAHKYLPCGTKVTLQYGNRTVVARVIDRGPYIAGRDWDLTEQTKHDLGFGGVGVVWTNR